MGNSAQKEKRQPNNGIIIDVRSEDEYCSGHLRDAILVPTPLPPLTTSAGESLHAKLTHLLQFYPREHPVYLYCKKGVRAGVAKQILQNAGYKNVVSMGGVESGELADYLNSLSHEELQRVWWTSKSKQ